MRTLFRGALLGLVGCIGLLPLAAAASEDGNTAWLGVWLAPAIDGGVEVVGLVPGGPAMQAGIRVGDLVLEAEGKALADDTSLGRLLETRAPGDELKLSLARSGRVLERTIRIGQRGAAVMPRTTVTLPPIREVPAPAPSTRVPDRLQLVFGERAAGLQVAEVTPALRRHYGAPENAGVLVTRVQAGTYAERAGIRVGDVIVKIGEHEIRDRSQVAVALIECSLERPIKATYVRDGRVAVTDLVPAEPTESRPADPEDPRRRRLELEIDRLERRIDELRRELERSR